MSARIRAWGIASVQRGAGSPAWVRRGLLVVTATLLLFGLVSVYSASSFMARSQSLPDSHFVVQQLAHAAVGTLALVAACYIDYRLYRRIAWPLLGVVAFLLVLLLLPWTRDIGPVRNGARRWLDLGVTFQPSELAKVAVVIWTASLAVKKQDRLHSLRYGLLPFLLVLGPLCVLILLEPHFSATMITGALALIVLFAAGARLGHFAVLGAAALPLVYDQVVNTGYRMNRVMAFLNPALDAEGVGYQLRQSLIAVGSGGVLGVGFGESTQKLHYLPEPQNDFIYPIIAEEWGLIGAIVVLALYLAWTLLGLRIAAAAPDLFGRLLAIGLTAIVAIGAFGHVGVTIGVLPTTGVSLPFISAGGSGLVIALGVTGVLLNIAARRRC
ncbi:MAG: putative lipid II flippase FtsW [Gemmatimonadota bacterium]